MYANVASECKGESKLRMNSTNESYRSTNKRFLLENRNPELKDLFFFSIFQFSFHTRTGNLIKTNKSICITYFCI